MNKKESANYGDLSKRIKIAHSPIDTCECGNKFIKTETRDRCPLCLRKKHHD